MSRCRDSGRSSYGLIISFFWQVVRRKSSNRVDTAGVALRLSTGGWISDYFISLKSDASFCFLFLLLTGFDHWPMQLFAFFIYFSHDSLTFFRTAFFSLTSCLTSSHRQKRSEVLPVFLGTCPARASSSTTEENWPRISKLPVFEIPVYRYEKYR